MDVIRRLRNTILFLLPSISGAGILAESGGAQPVTDTVYFVHGLEQHGGHWYSLATDLAQRHNLFPVNPGLTSRDTYAAQAATLSDYLSTLYGGLNEVEAITHSNGGVVTRVYVDSLSSPRIHRHLTLGTPHKGAKLAQHVLDGSLVIWVLSLAEAIRDPIWTYRDFDPEWDDLWFRGVSSFSFEVASLDMADVLQFGIPIGLQEIGFFKDWINQLVWDVLPGMVPGSPTFSTLNSSSGLASEAQKLGTRASISTEYPIDLAPWASVFSNYWVIEAEQTRRYLVNLAISAYFYYEFHPNWELRQNAWKWEQMWWALSMIPADWQFVTDARFHPSDGIVSEKSSKYPGSGSLHYPVAMADLAIHHKAQLNSVPNHDADAFRVLISNVLTNELLIEDPPPPPPPTLTVDIDGDSEVPPTGICSWLAIVGGGEPPYSYQWSGILSGTDDWIWGLVPESGWLYLTVTSSDQQQASSQLFVEVSEHAEECAALMPR
jgi:hypothetical protein